MTWDRMKNTPYEPDYETDGSERTDSKHGIEILN